MNLLQKLLIIAFVCAAALCASPTQDAQLNDYKNRVKKMFYHAYDSYIHNAYPYDELKPISCSGFDTWGSYSLTLIDSLDMLIILDNRTEFERVVKLIEQNLDFNKDINVSVFETNIRVIGGLLSAHLLAYRLYMDENNEVDAQHLDPNWPCDGPLLRMAVNMANKLLPAFATATGMPYGTVNLRHGVPSGETQETCTAGVGTFIVEFATLSRLTGDPVYEKVATRAMDQLWAKRSSINLVGNHINIDTGRWTAHDATIGSGVDSYFEYLVKGAVLLNKREYLEEFQVYKEAIQTYLKQDNWYLWANMNKGHKSLPLFSSLDAYYPGVLTMVGDLEQARKTLLNYYLIWRQFGTLPEFYNVQSASIHSNRETYPLRPEFIESLMYFYKATDDEKMLSIAFEFLESIETVTRLECGYATVKDVRDHRLENRMESFFLAETLKYLYLIFDKDNFLFSDAAPKLVKTRHGECTVEIGYYVFNTEAHPIDGAALACCQSRHLNSNQRSFESIDLSRVLERYAQLNAGVVNSAEKTSADFCNFDAKMDNISDSHSTHLCNLNDYFKLTFQTLSASSQFLYP